MKDAGASEATRAEQRSNDSSLEARRIMRLMTMGLGALWTLDGLLQLQPQMFTQNLSVDVVGYALMALPAPLYLASVNLLIHFIMPHITFWDLLFSSLQIGIGVSLLVGPARVRRVVLGVSVVWGLVVWVFGEGMSGIFTGTMAGGVFPGTPSILNGFPGAALVYVLIALLLLLIPARQWRPSRHHSIIRDAPVLLFLVCSAVQAAPLMWTTFGQASIFAANLDNVPTQLVGTIAPFAKFAAANPVLANGLELGACLLSTFGLWKGRRWGSIFALAWLGFIWWFGLGLGGTLTGGGTDLNAPPAIALLMAPAIAWRKSLKSGLATLV